MPKYKVNGRTFNIPDNEVDLFEADFPEAQLHYQTNDGRKFTIYANERKDFLSDFPDATELGWGETIKEQAKQTDPFQPEDSLEQPMFGSMSYQDNIGKPEDSLYYPSPLNEEGRAEAEPITAEERSKQEYDMLMRQLNDFDAQNGEFMDTYEAYEKAAKHQVNEGGFALDTLEREYVSANSNDYHLRKQERDALNDRIKNNSYFNQMRMSEADAANETVDAISNLMAQNEAENKELHKRMQAMNALAMNPRGSFSGFAKTKEMQEYMDERADLETAKRLYENTAQVYAAPINDGEDVLKKFGQGFGQRIEDADFWSMGILGIADDMNARAAFQKIQDKFGSVKEFANLTDAEIDALLTPSEQLLISAVMDNNAAMYARKDNTAGAYEAGSGAADSLMFMAQFLLTGGIGDAATVGTAAHKRLVSWLGRKVGSMSNGLMKDVARGAVKLGVGTAESIGKALVMTPLMPHTYANIADKMMSFDDNGELMDTTDAIISGSIDALIETWSESTGDFVNKILGVPGDITKGVAKKVLKNVDFSDWGKAMNAPMMKILKKGGFNGFLGEMGEEFIGNATRSLVGTLAPGSGQDPEALKNFAQWEQLLVTAGSFAPMTIFGLGTSAAQYGFAKRKLANAQSAFESMLRGASYTEDQAKFIIDELLGSTDANLTPEKLVANFSPLLRELAFNDRFANNRTQAMQSAVNFMWEIARYRTFDGVYHRQEEQQRNDMLAEIQEGTGREFWTTRLSENAGLDGTAYETDEVRAVEFNDGRVAYILGSDGTTNTVVYNDGQTGFLSEEQLNEGKTNGSIVSDATMDLNDYLTQQVARVRMTGEEQRMFAERNSNIGQIRAQFPIDATVELGTTEAPIQGVVRQQTPDGVIVESPAGISQLTWEELGHTIGVEVNPQTDAQMEEEAINNLEIADLQRRREREQRRTQRNTAAEAALEAEQMLDEAENEGLEKPIPMKADGTVDQTAFWNESPARWAQWKTEQRQDGGAYASSYIQNAIGILEGQIAESEAAFLAESDFDAKDALEQTINQQKARLAELQDLAMQYMPSVIPTETIAEVTTEQPASTEETPAAQAEPKPRERSVESEVARLYDLGLSDEEVVANLDAKVAKAQKALDAQSKKAPKMGADENTYIIKKREHQQKMRELQQELDFATAASKAVNETLAQQSQAPEAPGTVAIEKDPEPQNAVEFAARELGLKEGGIKLQRQSFSKHTGYGPSEMKKFFGLFKSKQDGGMTIEQAGERLMEMDREDNTGFFDQNDPNAGMDAILDALSANQTIGELRSYTARRRQEEAQKEADAAYSAMMADYEAAHGMSAEEVVAYDAVMNAEAIQKGLNETEYNELNSIFAEEISEYDTRTEESFGQSDGEVPSDVERGGEAVPEGSDNVLQSLQSDYTATEGTSPEGEQSTQDADNVQPQNGNPQVQPAAVESSLDEDMPDFTSSASAYFPNEEMRQKFSAMRVRINEWAQKLGVQVRIMATLDDVVNQSARQQVLAGKKVYGYFDPATGEVAFYLPDFLSLDGHELTEEELLSEIDKTYIHEVVSHRGLRGLLGEEKYGELCDMVWDAMTEKQKANFLNYPGVNGNSRIAADEFIAHFAENVDYNDNRTLWDKIVDFIKAFFNSVELPAGISNESLAELLRHSYRNLAKSAAAIDTNANKQAEGNTVLRAANGSLVGMHNISEDKLRKVIKQGGLANPSTAVVNIAEYLLDGYGEISLIMPSSLVDAGTGDNVGTYTGDAWTPTYPPISRKVDNIGWKVIKDLIRSVVSDDSPLYHDIINGLENYLEDNRSSKMEFVFLKEKGIEPEIAYKGADGFVGMRNLEAVLGVQGLRDGMESYERYKNASPMAKRSFNMWLAADGNKQAHKELKEQIKKEPRLAEVLKLNEDVSFAAFDSFTYDIFRKEQDAGKIDTYDTMGAAARYVDANNLRGEFEAWLESLMQQAGAKEVFFAGYTRGGDRIYKDNTLENVSRHMRLQGRTNAYDDHGLSATKSALLQRLTSLSQIRKNKARLQNKSAYNKEYDALKDRLWSIISQLADMQEISSNQFMNVDYAESRLQESFTKKNPIAHLNKEFGYDIDPAGEYADELNSFIKDVQQMPAKYFETKFERPVYLNEFAAAVMPTKTSEDIKQAISEAGLPIFEYDSEVQGSRKEATLKATEGEGIRFRVLGEKGAANLDKAEEATIRLDNLGVARQMEEAGKDAKSIKLATGWERGADNLWRYEVADDFDLAELEKRLQENLNDGFSKTWGVLYPSDLGDLTKAYPDFNVDIMVWVGDEFENTGEYSPATEGDETTFGRSASIEVKAKTVADIKDVLVHEIQHAIQEKEGFADGGSVFGLKDKLSSELDKRVARIKELRAEGRDAEAGELMRMSKGLAEAVINNDADTYQNYRKLAGEVEARNVANRLYMSSEERLNSLLSETEDVAREDQIFLRDNLMMKSDEYKASQSLVPGHKKGQPMLSDAEMMADVSFRITPEQDKAYMDAVEAGDMETAQRMVIEAAKIAMPNTKVVDEDGNPKIVYHGTSHEEGDLPFTIFDQWNGVSWFTEEKKYAKSYTRKREDELGDLYSCFLNFETPISVGNLEDHYDNFLNKLSDLLGEDIEVLDEWAAYHEGYEGDLPMPFDVTGSPLFMEKIVELGYDGVIADEFGYTTYGATSPSQIKSADPVTYDDDGKVIPLSERFNPENEDIRFRVANDNQAIFVSNAAKAVEGIKMEKATPEQWLKMIEKNGGLKAGEDKWMGLSDWLKASDKKTLNKQEVLDFINENMIVIEEQHYSEDENALDGKRQEIQEALQGIYDEYVAESEDMNDDMFMKTHYDYAIQKLADELGYTAFNAPFINNNAIVELNFYEEDLDTLHELSNRLGLEKHDGTRNINDTRLSYTTEGLTDRHEIALTVPTIEPWDERDEVHFGDAGDGRAVAWIRFGDAKKLLGTIEVDGKKKFNWAKVLVIDEIQSKRHQEGREKGYKPKDYWPLRTKYLTTKTVYDSFYGDMEGKYGEAFSEASTEEDFRKVMSESDFSQMLRIKEDFERASNAYIPYRNSVPDAPFEKNWHELAMKRMLRYAAENGYDVIAWTKGDQQAERYHIGDVVASVDYRLNDDGTYHVDTMSKLGYQIESVPTTFNSEQELANVFGKEIAKKIVGNLEENKKTIAEAIQEKKDIRDWRRSQGIDQDSPEYEGVLEKYAAADEKLSRARKGYTLSESDFRIGGEGMKGFYDKMLPAFMNKYGKKWGVKVEDIHLNLENGLDMHSVPVTEEMKASVMEGQVMFRTTGSKDALTPEERKAVHDIFPDFNEKITKLDEIPSDWFDSELQAKQAQKMAVESISDEHFTDFVGSVILPTPSKALADKINSGSKEILIKRGVFAKNAISHNFTPEQSRNILASSLYSPNLYGQSQKTTRPLNWVVIRTGDKNEATILEVNDSKDYLEVVSWYTMDSRNLDRIKRQAKREGGEILILDSEESLAASLSALPSDLSSEDKFSDNIDTFNDSDENISLRVTGTPTDEVVANGLQLTPAQTAEVAANIFAALPEESRKKITEGLNGNLLGLKDAILQIPTSLASKENWNDEDKQMADVVAEEMTKMAGEMTRPFSAEEGLWLLYNNLNKGTDLVSQASRALVQRNLGFDAETLAKQEQAKEDVRFRTVGDASSNAEASLYNRGAVNVWTRLKESYVDMMASVEELVKAVEKRTGKVAQGFENILLALNQQSSKGLAAMESYTQKFLNPMFDEIRRIMDETKMKYEDVVRYVILKHGLERNKKLAQRDARAHYQEIYDDIISKITGMTAAQKRTYLTNAQLKEGDAKAELATLQAVDMSAMTDEEKREHKKKLAAARKAVEEAEEHLKRAQKIASMSEQEAQDELDKIFEKIENGTDSVFKEMRDNDYSGISSMFYDQLGVDRKNFSTEEQYQAALMEAKKDRYSSLKDIEAAAEAEVKSFEGKTDTKELWKRINAATKETLRQQYEANMISKDQYLNLRDMFEFYVPLRGFKDNTAEDMYTYYRKPNSTGYTKPILGAEGRKTEAESPFGWIAAMAGSAIASNVKNEAKLALYYFVSNRPENGIATISKTWFVDSGEVDERGKKIFKPAYPPFSEDLSSAEGKAQYEIWQANMKELQKKGQAYEAGQRLNLGNAVVNISDANKPEHIVNVKVGGKDYTIIINGNPRAAQAINGDLNIEGTAQDYSALFGPVLRWMSSVNTSYNPEFWITNMMRDMAFTMMAVNIKEDPVYRRKFSKNYRKAFKVVSLVAKNEKGTIGDSYLEQQYKDFVKYGGVTGYTQIKDSETWEQEIENYLSSTDPESLKSGKVMRGIKSAFHVAHRFGESLEQVSRFAAFLTARETGKSINEAINDAKEITVNFNRKGSGKMITLEEAKYLTGKNGQPLTKPQQWMVVGLSSIAPLGRRFIMFFNAAIQGLNATYKLMKKNPKRFAGWALGYAAVGMMNAVLHAMLDDDDDYLDIPQYERRNSLMIGGNGAYFKWALPQEARAFYALGDLAVETVMGRNPHQNFLGEALKIGTEILPVNPSEGWKAFMPSVAIPFIELALNEDYKGAPIYNEQKWLSEEEKERTAKWSNAYQGTGWTYVKIAQGLNFITGGDKHDAGWINLQPEKLEHLVQSAFGGTIRTADKFINTISAALDPEEPMTIRQTPFLNRFLTINDERFKNVHVNDVFDYYKADAEHALTLEKQYIKDRDMDSLTELRSSDEYQWAKIYGKYKKPLKAIQDKIKVADGTAEKKELMKQQDELKKRMIKEISEL